MSDLPHLLSLDFPGLQEQMLSMGESKFRAKQVWDWMYKKFILDPDQMLNLSKQTRRKIKENFNVGLPEIHSRLEASDGTTKLLLKSEKGQLIETVVMRYEGRTSLCVSSQVGCKLACSFCQTGKLGFVRHLKDHEILAQLIIANQILKEDDRKVSHVVFMGMGEPFDNYEDVVASANKMMAEECFFLSARHVTVSTSGLAREIDRFSDECRAALAISLHAPREELRTELMPINKKYSLETLKTSLVNYQKKTGKKITIEYILIGNKNCSLREAKELVKFLHGLKAKVNLIPFNAHPGLPYSAPTDVEIRNFQKHLADRSYPAPVRYSKGQEVSGACGQLAAKVTETLSSIPKRESVLGRSL